MVILQLVKLMQLRNQFQTVKKIYL